MFPAPTLVESVVNSFLEEREQIPQGLCEKDTLEQVVLQLGRKDIQEEIFENFNKRINTWRQENRPLKKVTLDKVPIRKKGQDSGWG